MLFYPCTYAYTNLRYDKGNEINYFDFKISKIIVALNKIASGELVLSLKPSCIII